MSRIPVAFALLVLAAPALGGCVGLAAGAVATGGIAIAEERSLGSQIDDVGILFDVSTRLEDHDAERFDDVSVDVTEGRVLLTGTVPEPGDRVDAVRLAWQAADVAEVVNELEVADARSLIDALGDARISTELGLALVFDNEIDRVNYTVDTVNRVVYLTGVAQDDAELRKVIDHARTIAGVEEVISYVRLKES